MRRLADIVLGGRLAPLFLKELRQLKRMGFSDRRLAYLLKVKEADVRAHRHAHGVRPRSSTGAC